MRLRFAHGCIWTAHIVCQVPLVLFRFIHRGNGLIRNTEEGLCPIGIVFLVVVIPVVQLIIRPVSLGRELAKLMRTGCIVAFSFVIIPVVIHRTYLHRFITWVTDCRLILSRRSKNTVKWIRRERTRVWRERTLRLNRCPEDLQLVTLTRLFAHDVENDIPKVNKNPLRNFLTRNGWLGYVVVFHRVENVLGDGADVRYGKAGTNNKEVCDVYFVTQVDDYRVFCLAVIYDFENKVFLLFGWNLLFSHSVPFWLMENATQLMRHCVFTIL